MSLLVVDVGTSGVRAAVVDESGRVGDVEHRPVPPTTPAPGLVEFDPDAIADAALTLATTVLERSGPVRGVGIANQRASTIVWERGSGRPVGPGIGWQDLRTVGTCLTLQGEGVRVAPNASATKLSYLLDTFDPDRSRDLCFGTVDSWVAWTLSSGALHVTDATNAGVTGLQRTDATGWSDELLRTLRIPPAMLPVMVDSSGMVGEATALPGSPPICALAGDQQASLVGQGCTLAGLAKATFGTGGMLDACVGDRRPAYPTRGAQGTFPIVAWRRDGRITWGVEAVMLSAGTCVEWLRDDLGVIDSAADSEAVAARCADTGDVWFVPALLGLGTPFWDFGARGTVLGISRGTGRPELVRAVLEGVAHRGADLLQAAEADAGLTVAALRIDGGMSANGVFVQALADAIGRPVEISPELEATALGAAYLAGMALGIWKDEADVAAAWRPRAVVEPVLAESERVRRAERWQTALERARGTVPELSALDF